jgi:hypothetical protein
MVARSRTARPLGVILHRGQSPFDGSPYVVIMPLGRPSKNGKTGKMLQTYIIRSHVHPVVAVRNGGDVAICNNCPMRGLVGVKIRPDYVDLSVARKRRKAKKKRHRACYVNVGQGPAMVYDAFKRGRYVDYVPALHDEFIRGRKVRFGTYGEPVLIPLELVQHLASLSAGWTGYTHQWSNLAYAGYRQFLMASVHGLTGPWSREHAKSLGWRCFRTMRDGLPAAGEILCPASKEAGKRLTCEQCRLCDGAGTRKAGLAMVDVYIPGHGGKAIMTAVKHLPILQEV